MKNGKLLLSNSLFKTVKGSNSTANVHRQQDTSYSFMKRNMINVNSVVKQNTGFSLQIECLAGLSELVNSCRYVGMLVSV